MRNPAATVAPLPTSGAAERVGSSAIRDLLHLTERADVLSLAGGLPSAEAFPVVEVAEATAAILGRSPGGALQYSTTEGLPALRRWVAAQAPVPTAPDQVLVTHGSQQALDLLARATLAPGATVALADPGYVGALQAFRLAEAHLVGIPVDDDGMRVDVLADRCSAGLRPALVYVVAEFDNPSGVTLGAERRGALADLAERYGFLVVEDDPYGTLRWSGARPPALRTLTDRVVALGTTSKVLTPGLRVGWAVGPTPLMRRLVTVKQAADLHTNGLGQHVAAELLGRPGFLDRHGAGLRDRYQRQADALVEALAAEVGDRLHVSTPQGGMFCWATFLDGTDTTALLPRAVDAGVAFVPGRAFAVDDPHRHGLRLSFATEGPDALREAVRRLALALTA